MGRDDGRSLVVNEPNRFRFSGRAIRRSGRVSRRCGMDVDPRTPTWSVPSSSSMAGPMPSCGPTKLREVVDCPEIEQRRHSTLPSTALDDDPSTQRTGVPP